MAFAHLERRLLAVGRERQIPLLLPWPAKRSTAQRLASGLAPRESMEIYRRHDPGHPWSKAWKRTGRLLMAFADDCRALDARCLVLVIPSADQVQRSASLVALDIELGENSTQVHNRLSIRADHGKAGKAERNTAVSVTNPFGYTRHKAGFVPAAAA